MNNGNFLKEIINYLESNYKILEYNEELNILQGVKNGQYKNTK